MIYVTSQCGLRHWACRAWTMLRPGPGGSAQPSWPWWVCSRQYSCFRWVTMLSLISGIEICRRTLPLSKDRVLSPENISVIIRATTGMICGTEEGQDESHSQRLWEEINSPVVYTEGWIVVPQYGREVQEIQCKLLWQQHVLFMPIKVFEFEREKKNVEKWKG